MISSIAAVQLLFCTGHQRQPFMVKRLQRQRKENVTHLDSAFMWCMKETTLADTVWLATAYTECGEKFTISCLVLAQTELTAVMLKLKNICWSMPFIFKFIRTTESSLFSLKHDISSRVHFKSQRRAAKSLNDISTSVCTGF